ncbi:TetR/AcrR family transcriptional regulator [uncultured Gordonia sp.]|uniref:TetR/AcrR family transcriptional regulator n=1 Tax=uncultured Gordonia sp. TaxID=198437 RepID=UPI00258CB621|nr:TetR/AcrR family transcriptional regulator [uncultured Gordonia sp.]
MAGMARPKIHDDDLRRRLVDEATAIVETDGLGTLSVRSVARAASTSTTAVYSLFGSKDDLTRAVLVRALRDFTAAQREAGTEEPIEHVTALGTAYVGWALANPRLYELMFGLSALGIEATEETIAAGADAFAPLHEAVAAAISSGAFRPADPTTVTASLWAQVHGASLLILAGLFPDGADPVPAISAIVDGWRVDPIR